jgi:peptidoglycan DL-endopeptidase CwlO
MIKKYIKYTVAAVILATTLQATPTFANPVTKGQIDATKEQINNFETKIQQLDNRIILAMENSQKLNEEIKTQQGKIIETEAEIEKAEVAFDNHKKVYSERLKSIQLKGDQSVVSYAELLLSSGSLSEFFNRFTAISQIIENDTDLLDGLNQKENSLKEAEKQLHNQINQLEKSKLELASEQKQIEEDKKQIETDLADAQSILQNQQNQMAQQVAQLAAQQLAQQTQQPVTVSTNTPSTTTPPTVPVNVTSSASANAVIANAKQYLGVPYVWGGSTPSGFDCSGFVQYVYRSVGISLPRTARAQQNVGTRISVNQVQPGDLVFNGKIAYHVGIYIGGGQYIHAPQTGDVVKIASYDPSRFSSAARILP